MIKAVIFDYDGVLNDSLDVIRRLYDEFYEIKENSNCRIASAQSLIDRGKYLFE